MNPIHMDIIQGIIRRLMSGLGTNEDFKVVCDQVCTRMESELYWMAYLIMWDVDSEQFQDVLKNRWRFSVYELVSDQSLTEIQIIMTDSGMKAGKETYDLVKLNLQKRMKSCSIFLRCSAKYWIDEFDIDGLRLDVAYCLDHDFLRRLRSALRQLKSRISSLLGEMLAWRL